MSLVKEPGAVTQCFFGLIPICAD